MPRRWLRLLIATGTLANVAAVIPVALSVVAGYGDHITTCYDDAFHAAVIALLRAQWSL